MTDHYIPGVDRVEPGAAVMWQGRKVGEVVRVDDDGTVELSIGPGAHGLFADSGAAYSIAPDHGTIRESRPLCPECAQGKTQNCISMALDPASDDFVPCRNTPVLYGDGLGPAE